MRVFGRFVLATLVMASAASVLKAQDAAAPAAAPTLKDPATLIEPAPDKFRVKFDTNQGTFVVEVTKEWAPRGATRFYNLVKNGYYNDTRFYRVVNQFMAQVGVSGDPAINSVWRNARIVDDPRKQSNERSYVAFAQGGTPNTRTTQIFVNMGDNKVLDSANFAPFGKVVSGMNVIEKLYSGYGDGPPKGKGPDQSKIQTEGNEYLMKNFPKLDYIKTATLEPEKN